MTARVDKIVVERVPLDQLHPDPANAKLHDQRNVDVIAGSLQEHGQYIPLIAQQSTGRILKGNGTYAAMKQIGWTEADVVWFDCDDLQATRLALVDNRSSELGEWDEKTLLALLQQAGDVESLGWNPDEFETLLDNVEIPTEGNDAPDPGPQEDKAAELQVKWQTAPGQLWLIPSKSVPGRAHRLLVGDSTQTDDVRRVMAGERAALFSTDPPYLVGYTGDDRPKEGRNWSETYHDWDPDTEEEGAELYDSFIQAAVEHAIQPDAAWYCWHASRRQKFLEEVWNRHGAFMHQQIIWVKDRPILTHSFFLWQHEPCMFGWLKGNKPRRVGDAFPDRATTTVWPAPTAPSSPNNLHPTSKPTLVFEIPMLEHTKPGEICYEPFAGSGSQHVAGEKLGRLVYGIELEPRYAAVILERLAGMGLEPKLAEGDVVS